MNFNEGLTDMVMFYRLGVTLADGTRMDFDSERVPKHWKSWVMQRCGYGTDFYGARFHSERHSAPAAAA